MKGYLTAAVAMVAAVVGIATGDYLGPAVALADSPPNVTIDPPTGVTSTSASLSGTVNPNGGPSATAWHFEFATSVEPENWIAAGGGEITGTEAEESNPVAVATTLQGLGSNTEYLVRLVAANEEGANVVATEAPYPTFTTDAVAPTARTLAAFPLAGGTSALLGGEVDPKGSPTTYWIEYGATAAYGSSAPLGEDGEAGAGNEATVFAEQVGGLVPDSIYHFRIVAQSSLGTVQGADLTFRTAPAGPAPSGSCANASLRAAQHADFLTECRAYEMVSPVDKNGADIAPGGRPGIPASAQSSLSGDALAYVSSGIFADPIAGAAPGFYLGSRGAANWSSVQAAVPQQPHQGAGYASPVVAMSADLSREIIRSKDPLLPGTPQQKGVPNVFLRDNRDGSLKLVTTAVSPLTIGHETQFVDASADFSHVLFTTTAALTPEAPAGVPNLYEWIDGPTPQTRLVSVLPGGEGPSPVGALAAIWENGPPTTSGQGRNAISADGSRILFVGDSEGVPSFPVGQIYLREDGLATARISASQRSVEDPNGPQDATFGAATPDQAFVYFTSGEKLTEDATTGPGSLGSDLYRYETATGTLTDLTVDGNPQDPNGAEVLSNRQQSAVVAVSTDGSYVYFMARGKLAPGGVAGAENLYLWHDGTIDHVASGAIANNPAGRFLVTTSPSGRYLAFASSDRLTAYPNAGHQETYLYDAAAGMLDCVSCDPDGAPATADAALQEEFALGALESQGRRYVLDDGSVFFNTAEQLVGTDGNGVGDAYRYRDGRVSLISTGRSEYASSFYDASPSGNDVFFSTREALVSQDVDNLMDAYDARSGGGLAAQNLSPSSPPCAGEDCREPASPWSGAGAPASSTVVGATTKPQRHHHHKKHKVKKHKGKKHKRHHKKRGRHAKSRHARHTTAKHG